MALTEFETPIIRALAVHEALRKLGFAPDEIFVELPERGGHLAVVLKDKMDCVLWRMVVGSLHDDFEIFSRDWAIAIAQYNSDKEWAGEIWEEYGPVANSIQFVTSIMAAGISLPNVNARKNLH